MNDADFARRCADVLSAQGPVAGHIAGFSERAQQLAMTRRVAAAVAVGDSLVVEAGTGIGKTFAYLVPAVLSGRRTIISTGTRHLQDQIYFKDLPIVLEALDAPVETALLKGRANYLCLERLDRHGQTQMLDPDAADSVEIIRRWSRETADGDINSLKEVAEDDAVWPLLLSTPDTCLGSNCPRHRDCFVSKARQKAAQADLVVVNHHLLMADMALKEEGFMELLPGTDTIIVDEAHQLRGVAESNFTERLTSRGLADLLRDCESAAQAGDSADSADSGDAALAEAIAGGRSALERFTRLFAKLPERAPIAALKSAARFDEGRKTLTGALEALASRLKPLRELSEQWHNLWQRNEAAKDHLARVLDGGGDAVAWFSRTARSFQLCLSPCDVSSLLAGKTRLYDANWIYTSATIAVGDDFTHFLSELGLDPDSAQAAFDSPFDYQLQTALYLPENLPDPNDEDYTEALMRGVKPLLEMSDGRAFLLFTSYRALNRAAEWLAAHTAWRLLVQGRAPKMELIRRFGDGHGKLLLGTNSFREGVDVKGAALSCVVIDRLPFASPGDPVTQAKIARARELERNFFAENTLPEAVLALRQGVGRLIRDETDSGVIVIGDRRIRTKPYGRVFLDSLPPMKVFRKIPPLKGYFQ